MPANLPSGSGRGSGWEAQRIASMGAGDSPADLEPHSFPRAGGPEVARPTPALSLILQVPQQAPHPSIPLATTPSFPLCPHLKHSVPDSRRRGHHLSASQEGETPLWNKSPGSHNALPLGGLQTGNPSPQGLQTGSPTPPSKMKVVAPWPLSWAPVSPQPEGSRLTTCLATSSLPFWFADIPMLKPGPQNRKFCPPCHERDTLS